METRREQAKQLGWRPNKQWLKACLAYTGHGDRKVTELLGYDPKHKVDISLLPKSAPKKVVASRAAPLVLREPLAGPSCAGRDESETPPRATTAGGESETSPRPAASGGEYVGDGTESSETEDSAPLVQRVRATPQERPRVDVAAEKARMALRLLDIEALAGEAPPAVVCHDAAPALAEAVPAEPATAEPSAASAPAEPEPVAIPEGPVVVASLETEMIPSEGSNAAPLVGALAAEPGTAVGVGVLSPMDAHSAGIGKRQGFELGEGSRKRARFDGGVEVVQLEEDSESASTDPAPPAPWAPSFRLHTGGAVSVRDSIHEPGTSDDLFETLCRACLLPPDAARLANFEDYELQTRMLRAALSVSPLNLK